MVTLTQWLQSMPRQKTEAEVLGEASIHATDHYTPQERNTVLDTHDLCEIAVTRKDHTTVLSG